MTPNFAANRFSVKFPLINEKYCTAGWVSSIVLAVVCLAWNNLGWPGAQFAAGAFLIGMIALFGLFAGESNKSTMQIGVLVFVVGTGILLLCARFPKLVGGVVFQSSLLPVHNDVGLLGGLLWLIPAFTSFRLAAKVSEHIYLRALIGGVLVLVPSIFMMLTAESLELFYWRQEVMSVKAIALWLVAGFFFHFAAGQMEVRKSNPVATRLYFTYFGFFVAQWIAQLIDPASL